MIIAYNLVTFYNLRNCYESNKKQNPNPTALNIYPTFKKLLHDRYKEKRVSEAIFKSHLYVNKL